MPPRNWRLGKVRITGAKKLEATIKQSVTNIPSQILNVEKSDSLLNLTFLRLEDGDWDE